MLKQIFTVTACAAIILIAGCKKEETKSTTPEPPFKNVVGKYAGTYHDHSNLPGAPPPTNVCDSSSAMTITISEISGDSTRLKLALEGSKQWCQGSIYFYEWCFSAIKDANGKVTGTGFKPTCTDNTPITIIANSLSITGDSSISCSVSYKDATVASGNMTMSFDFTGKKK